MQKQSLDDRMKKYEYVTRYSMAPKSFVLARIDGKAFHSYTKGLKRPFDEGLIEDMNQTAIALCQEIQNAKFAFVQSDEISILIHETEQDSQSWFNNNIQKMASVAASIATAEFNNRRLRRGMDNYLSMPGSADADEIIEMIENQRTARFDARFWTIPTVNEVVNYFLWRQQDCTKNSIASVAQANFSHKKLHGLDGNQMQELLFQEKGINWNNYPVGQKRGRFIERVTYQVPNTFNPKLKMVNVDDNGTLLIENQPEMVTRSKWDVVEPPIFSQDRNFLLDRIRVNY